MPPQWSKPTSVGILFHKPVPRGWCLNSDLSEIVFTDPHMCDHDHGGHEHGHDHAHTDTGGHSDNVYVHIDRDNVVALNSIGEGKQVIKPWDERLDEQVVSICLRVRRHWSYLYLPQYIESDADDQLYVVGSYGALLCQWRSQAR